MTFTVGSWPCESVHIVGKKSSAWPWSAAGATATFPLCPLLPAALGDGCRQSPLPPSWWRESLWPPRNFSANVVTGWN